jgi:hypothetical protein
MAIYRGTGGFSNVTGTSEIEYVTEKSVEIQNAVTEVGLLASQITSNTSAAQAAADTAVVASGNVQGFAIIASAKAAETQAIKDSAISETQAIKDSAISETSTIRDSALTYRSDALQFRNDALQFRNDAEAFKNQASTLAAGNIIDDSASVSGMTWSSAKIGTTIANIQTQVTQVNNSLASLNTLIYAGL